jgi:hypothetical protein
LQEEGQSTRHIVTEALLKLDDLQTQELKPMGLTELSEKLNHINQILEHLGLESLHTSLGCESLRADLMLSESFVTSVVKIVKPGIKLGL